MRLSDGLDGFGVREEFCLDWNNCCSMRLPVRRKYGDFRFQTANFSNRFFVSKNVFNIFNFNLSDDGVMDSNFIIMDIFFKVIQSIFDRILSDCDVNLSVFMR